MPVDLRDGPLGLEAVHTFASYDTRNGVMRTDLVLNEQGAWPRHVLTSIDGLHDTGDADDTRVALTGQPGEYYLPTQTRGKNVTYSGVTMGRTLQELRRGEAQLRGVAAKVNAAYELRIAPVAAYGPSVALTQPNGSVINAQPDWRLFGRWPGAALSQKEEQTLGVHAMPTPWQRPFTLTYRATDSRAYLLNATDSTSWTPSGTVASLWSHGTASADPVFEIHGPCSDSSGLVLSHQHDWRFLYFLGGFTLSATDVLTVDFRLRTAVITRKPANTTQDVSNLIDWHKSSWWDDDAHGLRADTDGADIGEQNILLVEGAGTWRVTSWIASY